MEEKTSKTTHQQQKPTLWILKAEKQIITRKKKNPGQSQTKTKMISDLSATFNARNIKMTIKFGGEKV